MTELRGQWALVTGASRGVGRQIALGLGKLGCKLIVHSRVATHTETLLTELCQADVEAFAIEGDLGDPSQIDAMVDAATRRVSQIGVLYNNAAVGSRFYSDPWSIDAEELRRVFEVDAISVIRISQRLAPRMISRGFGRIVNVTSGIANQPQLAPYAVAKAAVDKYTRDLAQHLIGTGVTMNLLDPGWLQTDLGGPDAPNPVTSVLPGALVPALLNDGVSGRWFSAQDYAGMPLEDAVAAARGGTLP